MIIRCQYRQTGKSYDIAQIMKKDKKAICFQPNAMQKQSFCKSFNIPTNRVFTPYDLVQRKKLPSKCKVYIDELSAFLMLLLKREIGYCTYTGDIIMPTNYKCDLIPKKKEEK